MIYSTDTEENVIGTLISSPDSIYRVADVLLPDCFFNELHKYIYEIILEVSQNSKVDMVTVSELALSKAASLPEDEIYENLPYSISVLATKSLMVDHLEEHCEILLKYRTLRRLYKLGQDIRTDIEQKKPIDEVIANATDGLVDATSNKEKTEEHVSEVARQFVDSQMKPIGDVLIPTMIPEIDSVIGGFEHSDLIILAGATSMGKTSLMLRILSNMVKAGIPSAVFSLEMSNLQLLNRILSMETMVKMKKIRYRDLDEADWSSINSAIGIYESKNFVLDSKSSKLKYIVYKIKKLVIKYGIRIVFIDFLQLINDHNGKGNREQEVARVARALKNTAKELGIVIVALSQLSRALMMRDSKRPMLSDLRESGEIEQSADTIMFAYREEYYNMENPREIQDAEIIIAKGRNAGTGNALMKFMPDNVKFLTLEEAEKIEGPAADRMRPIEPNEGIF